jgi:hypothetical protein
LFFGTESSSELSLLSAKKPAKKPAGGRCGVAYKQRLSDKLALALRSDLLKT